MNLKPNQKVILNYYQELQTLKTAGQTHEGAVAPLFANILRYATAQTNHLDFIEQYHLTRTGKKPLRADGVLVDRQTKVLVYGVWEAKDIKDNLKAVEQKFKDGYPKENILFQTPYRLQLYRHGDLIYDADIRESPEKLIKGIELFLDDQPPAYQQWGEALVKFKEQVGDLGVALVKIITDELKTNKAFQDAFEGFWKLCRDAINLNLADATILEMLVQHLLTERLFQTVFNHPEFRDQNAIAKEIEVVIATLTAKSFNRHEFLKQIDHFYVAIERAASTISDYSRKQEFLNLIYEQFFQGFAVKVADTHGIVYTPQPIVEFMVNSVEEILKTEFHSSLSSPGVQILDPFVGTGNFILRVLQEINSLQLEHKYRHELHCNEVMLLPYYIASLNIEHAFYERTQKYLPFQGICLVDTFELAEDRQSSFFVPENLQRIKRQKGAQIMVILGNPPYNAWQQNENDNNKNRHYEKVDEWVRNTYAKESKATNKIALFDPYVKAFAWATERLKDQEEGIVAFVTNNSFLDNLAFDGMRKQLAKDFSRIYVLNLGGNVRKNPKLSGTTHNVFGIQVGVCITLLVKQTQQPVPSTAKIYYHATAELWRKEQKYEALKEYRHYGRVEWQEIAPDKNHTWLTEDLQAEFENFVPLGTKAEKASQQEVTGVLFKTYGRGVMTCRDAWAYNFNRQTLVHNMQRTIETYNEQVFKWSRTDKPADKQDWGRRIDNFVSADETKISWDSTLKHDLAKGRFAEFSDAKIRTSLYRPFTKSYLFFDRQFNNSVYRFPRIFPTVETEGENQVICVSGAGNTKPFQTLMVNVIPDLHLTGDSQCFPFYTYAEDGSNRQENVTDWALKTFRQHYRSRKLTKWDIFHYVYGLLHHPRYREKYAANLKRELPRVPYATAFWALVKAGRQLAELHLNYETQPEYPLPFVIKDPLTWRVAKMRLSKDKTSLIYNDSLALTGIPAETFEYRLGNRSALEWVIDQYQVTQEKRSGIVNDPNRLEDEEYLVRLIGQVITVSLQTVKIVKGLPAFEGNENNES